MRPPAIAASPAPVGSDAAARLRLALAGSALLHLLGVSAMAHVGLQLPGVSRPATLVVRVEPLPLAVPTAPATSEAASTTRAPSAIPGAAASREPRKPAAAPDPPATFALPRQADIVVYSARELDSLPVPVLPLDIAGLLDRGAAAADLRLELVIDEHGVVNEVSFAAPGAAGVPDRELRAALAATPFVPARKDGRAVKSRIMLSVSLAASKAGE